MIRLIASDLDGTLLYGRNNSVSAEMFHMIREMKDKGIIFAAASGRQYYNLKQLFAPVWEDIVFICENGAAVFYKDELIAKYDVSNDELLKHVAIVDADEHTEVVLSSPYTTYVRPKTEEFMQSLIKGNNHITRVKEWSDVTEPCLKVAWFEKDGVEHRVDYWKSLIKPPAMVVTSGAEWMDILYPDCHKGIGIKALEKYFNIKSEEIVAFGDNYNDAEMLKVVGYPVAMKNGKEGILKLCPYHTACVEDTVRQILDGVFPKTIN